MATGRGGRPAATRTSSGVPRTPPKGSSRSGRSSGRPVFKSAFAAVTYEGEDGAPQEAVTGDVAHHTVPRGGGGSNGGPPAAATGTAAGGRPRRKSERPVDAHPGHRKTSTGGTQTSVFALVEDEEGGEKEACGSPKRDPIDLSKQSSMMHRLMESDRNDVDPRDVHKLLPGQLLSSKSLDLNVDLLQKAIALAAQNELQRENAAASMENGESSEAREDDGEANESCGQQDEVGEQPLSPASAPSYEPGQLVEKSPRQASPRKSRSRRSSYGDHYYGNVSPPPQPAVSPIPGWPSPPPHMVHHMSPAIGMAAGGLGARAPTPTAPYMDQGFQASGPYAMMAPANAAMGPMHLPWGPYPPPQPSYTPPPMHLHVLPGAMPDIHTTTSRPPRPSRGSMGTPPTPPRSPSRLTRRNSLPLLASDLQGIVPQPMTRAVSPEAAGYGADGGASPDGKGGNKQKRFRSVEAALAWCHVQHSQKQVPVVPKEDVKRLVEYQLQSGRPIRAPWYRPQKDGEDEDGSDEAEELPLHPVVPESMMHTPPQTRPTTPAQSIPKPQTPPKVHNERSEPMASPPKHPGKPPRSPTPLRMNAPNTPVRKPPSPPARMSPTPPFPSRRMLSTPPPPQTSTLPPAYRSATPPAQNHGRQNLPLQTNSGVNGVSTPTMRSSSKRKPGGTGFFVPPGLVV